MTWWAWMILGAVLFGAELFALDVQFYLVFLGISAALVGLLSLFGLGLPEWGEWLLFAALALISMFTFRKALYEKIRGNVPGFRADLSGDSVLLPEGLEPGKSIRTAFRGSTWTVVNEGAEAVASGNRATIVRSEGLTLFVDANAAASTNKSEEQV
ncbi:MAG TPA: NfeD family protein [Xanthomonadales bacterium]|nr:NfeD family protein [Xanthomonadales bacterium]